jgi:hypothetical protein
MNSHARLGIPLPVWTAETRLGTAGTALDGVILLQRGFIRLDNAPLTLNTSSPPLPGTHVVCDSSTGNLLMLFLALQESCNNIQGAWLDPIPYVQNVRFNNVQVL